MSAHLYFLSNYLRSRVVVGLVNPTYILKCIFLFILLGSYVVIERYKAPKNSALCLFSKVGNKLTQTTPKVTFLALFYSFLHYSCTFCPNNCTQKFLLGKYAQPTDYPTCYTCTRKSLLS